MADKATPDTISVPEESVDQRLDHFLAERFPEHSRTFLQKLNEQGWIQVNRSQKKSSYRLRVGDVIHLEIPPLEPSKLEPEAIPLDIVYEDPDMLVLSKPVDMVVHPSAGHQRGTIVNALLAHCKDLSGIGGVERPGIVHRLDKDVSGLLLVAKSDRAHQGLAEQFKSRQVEKEYTALTWGAPRQKAGVIRTQIKRSTQNRKKMAVVEEGGREALSSYTVIREFGRLSLFHVFPKTGRTHQIRLHMTHIGHPIVGDGPYGGRQTATAGKEEQKCLRHLDGIALHASRIGFRHPVTREAMTLTAPLRADFQHVLDCLEELAISKGQDGAVPRSVEKEGG